MLVRCKSLRRLSLPWEFHRSRVGIRTRREFVVSSAPPIPIRFRTCVPGGEGGKKKNEASPRREAEPSHRHRSPIVGDDLTPRQVLRPGMGESVERERHA